MGSAGRTLAFLLKASRPGLWFQTLWLYLLPVAAQPKMGWTFWLGVAYVLFPLNLLVYGWNDMVDQETDRLNPRKDSFLFGARGSASQLAILPTAIAATNLPFFAAFAMLRGTPMLLILAGLIALTALYNLPKSGLRSRPPLELLNQLGYLLLLPLSILLNQTPALPWQSFVYLVLFCTHAHLMGEIMDVEPDRQSGRRTTATVLGVIPTKTVVLGLVLAEALIILEIFGDAVLGSFLLLGAAWLVLDIVVFCNRSYTHNQFLLFGAALNVAGFASMAWVWYSGTLARLPATF